MCRHEARLAVLTHNLTPPPSTHHLASHTDMALPDVPAGHHQLQAVPRAGISGACLCGLLPSGHTCEVSCELVWSSAEKKGAASGGEVVGQRAAKDILWGSKECRTQTSAGHVLFQLPSCACWQVCCCLSTLWPSCNACNHFTACVYCTDARVVMSTEQACVRAVSWAG
jgi:hypothetical protein